MHVMEDETPEWKLERISEDCYDYNRHNYDYMRQELLEENFKQAPPISIAEYIARTSEVLPRGIFDEHDIEGILIPKKGKRYNDDLIEEVSSGPILEDSSQEHDIHNDNRIVHTPLHDDRPEETQQILKCENDVSKDEQISNDSHKKPEKQMKKKKKFKPFNYRDFPQSTSLWEQPWEPDFSGQFTDDKQFPPLS